MPRLPRGSSNDTLRAKLLFSNCACSTIIITIQVIVHSFLSYVLMLPLLTTLMILFFGVGSLDVVLFFFPEEVRKGAFRRRPLPCDDEIDAVPLPPRIP